MNIRHLKYAVEVERTGSITEAAEKLYITQPSLSKAIRELEADLGMEIFERTSRGVLPTRKGRALLEHARVILRQLEEIDALSVTDDASRQTFSVALPRASYLAEGASRFVSALDATKSMRVRIEELGAEEVLSAVSEGRVRLGVARYTVSDEARFEETLKRRNLKSELIWEYERVLLMASRGPLEDARAVEEAELAERIELTGDEGAREGAEEATRRRVRANGRASRLELLSELPGAYLWSSPLPPKTLSRYGLAARRAAHGGERFRDALICLREYRFTACDRLFIDKLFEVKNEMAFSVDE